MSGTCRRSLEWCHDLAKMTKLLFIFLFFFFFFSFNWIYNYKVERGKSHVTLSQCHNGVMDGHRWSCHGSQSQCVTGLE